MKDTKRRIELFSLYDHTNIEKHLEKMAAKGWMIEDIGTTFWRYKKIEPQKLNFSVVYYPKKVNEGIIVSADRQNFIDMCTSSGWNFVVSSNQMHVFYSESDYTPPIETDAEIQLECIHKFAKSEIISNYITHIIISLIVITAFGYGLLNNPVEATTDYLYKIWFYPLFTVFSLYNIIGYLVWHKKAKAAAEQGEFCETKRLIKFEVLFWIPIYVSSTLLKVLTLLRPQYILYLIGLIVAAVILLYFFKFIRKTYANARMALEAKRSINVIIGFLLFIGYVVGAVAAFHALPKPYEKIKIEMPYYTKTYKVYHDEGAPLNLEELIRTDKRISKEKFDDNAILVEQEKWTQVTDEEESVTLRYVITDIHFEPLYKRCKNELIFENIGFGYEDVKIGGLEEYEIYRYRYKDNTPADSFAFCSEKRIVEIHFDWEPTDEQLAIAAEKLMNAEI